MSLSQKCLLVREVCKAEFDSPREKFFSLLSGFLRFYSQGHFRPTNDVCAMSAFHPIATKLLHYGE